MIEIVLLLVIVALLALLGWIDFNNRKERKSLINAILAKSNTDLINLELVDKTKIEADKEDKEELTEVADLEDDEYDKFVLNK